MSGLRGARQRGEAVARHIVRDPEGLARRALDETAGQRLARRVGDGVHDDVERAPGLLERGEGGVDFGVVGDVELHGELRAERLGERLHAFLELLVDVGERELGAFAMHGLRDAPGDGTIGRHADDERALSAQETHVYPLHELTRPAFCQPRPQRGDEISGGER